MTCFNIVCLNALFLCVSFAVLSRLVAEICCINKLTLPFVVDLQLAEMIRPSDAFVWPPIVIFEKEVLNLSGYLINVQVQLHKSEATVLIAYIKNPIQ